MDFVIHSFGPYSNIPPVVEALYTLVEVFRGDILVVLDCLFKLLNHGLWPCWCQIHHVWWKDLRDTTNVGTDTEETT